MKGLLMWATVVVAYLLIGLPAAFAQTDLLGELRDLFLDEAVRAGGRAPADDEGTDCPAHPAPVPATGQSGCWDASELPTDCAGTGQDGEYRLGVAVAPRLVDNGDGTVTDHLTGLIWLRNTDCFTFKNWYEALSSAAGLASGSCGLTDGSVAGDWHLPNIKELKSLLDYGQFDPPLPPGHPFVGDQFDYCWSSTTAVGRSEFAWLVYFKQGFVYYDVKVNASFVAWPVRSAQDG